MSICISSLSGSEAGNFRYVTAPTQRTLRTTIVRIRTSGAVTLATEKASRIFVADPVVLEGAAAVVLVVSDLAWVTSDGIVRGRENSLDFRHRPGSFQAGRDCVSDCNLLCDCD